MNFGLFEFIWQHVVVQIQNATAGLIGALQGYVGPQFTASVTAYLVVRLLIACYSSESDAWQVFFRNLYLAGILYTLATTAGAFQFYVTGLMNGLVNGITTAIGGVFGAPGTITAQSFDHIAVKVFAFGASFFKDVGYMPSKAWLVAALVPFYWLFSLGGIAVIYVVYLAGAVVTNFFESFGSLFIALYFFPFTRKYFDGWLSVVVGGMLTQIFTIGWVVIFITSLGNMMTTIQAQNSGNVVNDIATSALLLILSWAFINIFAAMTGLSAYAAVRISGGIYMQISRSDLSLNPASHHQAANQNVQPPALPAPGGGGQDAALPGAGAPARDYAFNRNVGSAS